MKKILITSKDLTIGGIQKSLINFLWQLDYNKYEIDLVLLTQRGSLLKKVPSNVKIYYLDNIYKFKNYKLEELIKGPKDYKKLFSEGKQYDIAIAYDGYVSDCDYFVAYSNAKRKVIWVHSDFYLRKKHQLKFRLKLFKMKIKYNLFDNIVCVSESSKRGFLKLFPNLKDKVIVLGNFTEDITKRQLKEKPLIKLNSNDFNLISIGALLPVKGYKRLIKVQNALQSNNYKNVKIYIIGDGPLKHNLKKLIKKYKLENNFILLGQVENVYPILKQADLFINTSYYEGYPGVLLESLTVGVPLLVPNVSGAYDIAKFVAPNNSAYIVENSIVGFYQGIIKIMNNEKQGFSFDPNIYNDKLLKEYYKKILT